MKFGIYYSYWEQEWSADCLKYVEKVARLGFDVIEIAARHLNSYSPAHIAEVARAARDNGIAITAGLGPSPEKNLSSADPTIRKAGRAFFEGLIRDHLDVGRPTRSRSSSIARSTRGPPGPFGPR